MFLSICLFSPKIKLTPPLLVQSADYTVTVHAKVPGPRENFLNFKKCNLTEKQFNTLLPSQNVDGCGDARAMTQQEYCFLLLLGKFACCHAKPPDMLLCTQSLFGITK